MEPIAPKAVRYIKQGEGNCWAERAFADNALYFGFPAVSHELCLDCLKRAEAGDPEAWTPLYTHFIETEGRSPGKARDFQREVCDFYTLGTETLWVTFAGDRLRWCFAAPEVIYRDDADWAVEGPRRREVLGTWRDADIEGNPLTLDRLSSRLTKTASYRQTLCSLEAEAYLLRKINAAVEPVIARAAAAKAEMVTVAGEMIAALHWADFETLVDLIFARTGWQRISRLGGTMKDADLVLQHPTTGETAFVQVKSRADRGAYERSIETVERSPSYDRLYFVCHSPKGRFPENQSRHIHLWAGTPLADTAVRAGLYDWLVEKVG